MNNISFCQEKKLLLLNCYVFSSVVVNNNGLFFENIENRG